MNLTTTFDELSPTVSYANHLQCEPGFSFGPRVISNYQFLYVRSGRGCVQIAARRYAAVAGDLYFWAPQVVHSAVADSNRPFSLSGVVFDPRAESLQPNYGPIVNVDPRETAVANAHSITFSNGYQVPEHLATGHHPKLRAVIDEIVAEYSVARPGSNLLLRGLVLVLFTTIYRYGVAQSAQADEPALTTTVRDLMAHIEQAAERALTRDELESRFHMAYDHLARTFRRSVGYTPIQYHRECRLQQARQLLSESDRPMSEIAAALGFSSQHYFCRCFKQQTGVTPTAFREHTRVMR